MEIIIFLAGAVFGAAICGLTMYVWPREDPAGEKPTAPGEPVLDTGETECSTAPGAPALDAQWENLLRYDGTNQFTGGEEPDDEDGENGL